MIKNKKLIILTAAILFLGGFGFAGAIEYGMLGGKPANPDPNVENSDSWFIYNLKAGEKKEDAIQVMNLFNEPNSILLYAADTTPSSSGGFALKQFSEPKDEVGGWVKFYPEAVPETFVGIFASKDKKIVDFCATSRENLEKEFAKAKSKLTDDDFAKFNDWCAGKNDLKIELKGNERMSVPFVFSVPEKADVGEHTGGILIQKVALDEAQSAGSSVKLTTRVGVRIYETVPGEIIRKISVEGASFSKNFREFDFSNWFKKKEDRKAEEFSFNVRIKNEGNASAAVRDVIHFKDRLFGARSMDVEDRSFQVLKNDVFVSNFSWNNPRFGIFRLEREIIYPDVSGREQKIKVDPVSFWIIPWREMAAAMALLILLGAAYYIWKHHQKKKYGGIGWVKYAVKNSDTVLQLAEKHNISWKVLIKTNKLKAPYILEVGQVVLVPSRGKVKDIERDDSFAGEKKIVDTINMSNSSNQKSIPKKSAKPKKGGSAAIEKLLAKRKEKPQMIEKKAWDSSLIWISASAAIIVILVLVVILMAANGEQKKNALTMDMEQSISVSTPPQEEPRKEQALVMPEQAKINAADLQVKVLNEGAQAGLAGKVKEVLVAQGYAKAAASNGMAEDVAGNFIYYATDKFKSEAEKISLFLETKKIKSEVAAAKTDEQKSAEIVIILGK